MGATNREDLRVGGRGGRRRFVRWTEHLFESGATLGGQWPFAKVKGEGSDEEVQVRERKQLVMRDIYGVESALKGIVEALPAVNVIVSLLKSKGTMNDKELP